MKVLVCGGRSYHDANAVLHVLGGYPITHLIHGGARGADTLAARYALEANIPCTAFIAEWHKYGKSAGGIRNSRMLKEGQPDLVIAFPGGAGTNDMVRKAVRAGVKTYRVPEINYELATTGVYPGVEP